MRALQGTHERVVHLSGQTEGQRVGWPPGLLATQRLAGFNAGAYGLGDRSVRGHDGVSTPSTAIGCAPTPLPPRAIPAAPPPPQVSAGLLAAADCGEGGTLYRYCEPEGEGARAREQARARLARRFRLAPPGAAELRQRLGLHAPLHHGPGGGWLARGGGGLGGDGQGPAEDEVEELGFSVVATDSACRPAVGTVALPPVPAGAGSGAGSAADAARAAAVLDATGQLRLLRQRWPRSEPALHQLCAFRLAEPAVALLPGSLGYQGEHEGSASRAGAAGSAGSTQEMVAVTAAGGAMALLPLEASQAEQLALLQQALLQHPGTAPLGGGSCAAFRGTGEGESRALAYVHPPPPALDPAMADLLGPASCVAAPAALEQPAAAAGPEGPGAEPAEERGSSTPRAQRGVAADAPPSSAGCTPGAGQAQQARQAGPDAIFDAELLHKYLLMPPAEQRRVLADAGVTSREGIPQLAARLSNLVAQLLL